MDKQVTPRLGHLSDTPPSNRHLGQLQKARPKSGASAVTLTLPVATTAAVARFLTPRRHTGRSSRTRPGVDLIQRKWRPLLRVLLERHKRIVRFAECCDPSNW